MADPSPANVADLAEYGPAECLAALRYQFAAAHCRLPQYRGWEVGASLGIVRQRIGGGQTFVRAEVGDLILAKRRPGYSVSMWPDVTAYVPRVGWQVAVGMCRIDYVAGDLADLEAVASQRFAEYVAGLIDALPLPIA